MRDRVILAVFGSPDSRQIDGLGGATPLTSKVAIVSRSQHADADVDYLFGQVRITESVVDYVGNCGNLLTAVGPFAVDEGLVDARSPVTRVRIRLLNTDQIVTAEVPVVAGRARATGSVETAGVARRGAGVRIDLGGLGGTLGRGILPTRQPSETVDVDGTAYRVSIVDAGNPTVFVRASDLGVDLARLVADRLDDGVVERLQEIRDRASLRLGLTSRPGDAAATSPTIPKVYVVHPAGSYRTRSNEPVDTAELSLVTRGLSMGVTHPAVAVTVMVAIAAAAGVPGTVVAEVMGTRLGPTIRIGHPSGVAEITSTVILGPGGPALESAWIERTSRRLMSGVAFVPRDVVHGD